MNPPRVDVDLQNARSNRAIPRPPALPLRPHDPGVDMPAGGYHHHIGLNVWHSKGAGPAPVNSAGLYHFAILLPDRNALATTVKRILDHGWPLDGAADHLVSEAIYLRDPDGNGIELYRDRPRAEWPHNDDGSLAMATLPLDLDELLSAV